MHCKVTNIGWTSFLWVLTVKDIISRFHVMPCADYLILLIHY